MRKLIATIAFFLLAASPAARAQGVPLIPIVCGSAVSGCVLSPGPNSELVASYATCTLACFLMLFNSPTIPSNGPTTAGTAPGNMQGCIPIAAGTFASVSYAPGPSERFSTGISAAISSTGCGTLTLSPTAFVRGLVR
jgi:hypothetical protein